MANIKIEGGIGRTIISVDGQKVPCVLAAALSMPGPNELPTLELRIGAFEHAVEITEAKLVIGGLDAPEAVEKAMLDYLCRNYPLTAALKRATGGMFDTR